jgi:hypothetical protein
MIVVESVWMVVFGLVALAAALQLFPGFRESARRGSKTVFYGTALIAVVGWTLLKSVFVLAGRRLSGR